MRLALGDIPSGVPTELTLEESNRLLQYTSDSTVTGGACENQAKDQVQDVVPDQWNRRRRFRGGWDDVGRTATQKTMSEDHMIAQARAIERMGQERVDTRGRGGSR